MATLSRVLSDPEDAIIARHEAAEALGALGDASTIPVLRTQLHDPNVEIQETAQLALDLLDWRARAGSSAEPEGPLDVNPYQSHDPAPADLASKTVAQLRADLLDASKSMFDRYRAMFSLRNRGTRECVEVGAGAGAAAGVIRAQLDCDGMCCDGMCCDVMCCDGMGLVSALASLSGPCPVRPSPCLIL
jgi:HEAT repeat protein